LGQLVWVEVIRCVVQGLELSTQQHCANRVMVLHWRRMRLLC